jgi:hypothetical protein
MPERPSDLTVRAPRRVGQTNSCMVADKLIIQPPLRQAKRSVFYPAIGKGLLRRIRLANADIV